MYGLPTDQQCPYCGHTVEDHQANWSDDEETVTCNKCDKDYTVRAVYEFKGFLIDKQCLKCGEWSDDGMSLCECDEED